MAPLSDELAQICDALPPLDSLDFSVCKDGKKFLDAVNESMLDSNATAVYNKLNQLLPSECNLNACEIEDCVTRNQPQTTTDLVYTISIQILIFALVFGLAGGVDFSQFRNRIKSRGILVGLACQFFMMPFIGFMTILIFNDKLEVLYAVSLLVLTSSPGGSYSNWWCSLFNADLALSVAMTTASTIASVGFLPMNVYLYIEFGYKKLNPDSTDDIVRLLPFETIGYTLAVVIGAVVGGLYFGVKFPQHMKKANSFGTVCGFLSIALGVFASSTSCAKPWEQSAYLYLACLCPLVAALFFSLIAASLVGLPKPQRTAVAIETAYQNTGVALAVALSLGGAGRAAAVVPVIYGGYEAVCFLFFCLFMWWWGWTLSPNDASLWTSLVNDYQDTIKGHPFYEGYDHGDDDSSSDKNAVAVSDVVAVVVAVESDRKETL
jgi:predicted Na+-dependent transporter